MSGRVIYHVAMDGSAYLLPPPRFCLKPPLAIVDYCGFVVFVAAKVVVDVGSRAQSLGYARSDCRRAEPEHVGVSWRLLFTRPLADDEHDLHLALIMSTIPSRLARTTRLSRSPEEARARVIELYRDWYRSVRLSSVLPRMLFTLALGTVVDLQAPEIVSIYALNVSVPYFRQRIRAKFEENRHVTDVRLIDHLSLRGRQEYQETMNFWKQNDHILGTLLSPTGRPPRTFLQKFYEGKFMPWCRVSCSDRPAGRDEDQVLPAATGTVNYVP